MLTKEDLQNIGTLFDQKLVIFEQRMIVTIDQKIEELAILVKAGFDRLEKRFDRLEQKVYLDHEVRIEKLENRQELG